MFFSLALAALVFLFPLTIYFLNMGVINRRSRPVVVSGLWDAIHLIFALSGFLFGTFPMIIHDWYQRVAGVPTAGEPDVNLNTTWGAFTAINLSYYLLAVGGLLFMVHRRRMQTVVYNVDPPRVPALLNESLQKAGCVVLERHEDKLVFQPPENPGESAPQGQGTANALSVSSIDPFPAFCNAVVHWHGVSEDFQSKIERELHATCQHHGEAPEYPAGMWFLGVGAMLFGFMIFLAVFSVLNLAYPRRW